MCLGICHFDRQHSSSEPAHSLWTKQKAGDDAGPPCKTLQNIFDSDCPSPVLLFKCCYSVEPGTPNQQSQVSLFQRLEPQKGEGIETCRLSPEVCSWWNEHGLTSPSLTKPPPPPSRCLLVFLFLINSTASNFHWEAVSYLLFPNFPSLLQYAVLTLLSAPYIIYHSHLFVIWFLHMSCHLTNLILLRSTQTNLWVKKDEWTNKSERQASPHLSILHIPYEIPAPEIHFLVRWHLLI